MAIKVFISYSWTSDEYISSVLQLAKDLRHDGVDVILDQWDLKTGQDRFQFMEQSIVKADKVLILCDHAYADKANGREGGVGVETAIITPDVYGHSKQEKFIPVAMESFDNLPIYLKSRIAVDMRPGKRKSGYDELLRLIYEKPVHVKPELGEKPRWLDQPTLDTRLNMFAELFDGEDEDIESTPTSSDNTEWYEETAREQMFQEIFGKE